MLYEKNKMQSNNSIFSQSAQKVMASEKNYYDQIYHAEKLEQVFTKYRQRNMEQILKNNFS